MNASQLRQKAWDTLKGKYWPAVLAAFIISIFGAGTVSGGGINFNIDEDALKFFFEEIPAVQTILLALLGLSFSSLNLVRFILGGVIQLGYTGYLLKQYDGESHTIKDLFSQFDRFAQGFLQRFLRILYTVLWSLLFVIPGIVKAYSYAMTPYLMAENPEMSAKEAIAMSKQVMDGHKWELFCLEFSFIGWYLLAALTLGIGGIFLTPYVEAAHAAFYRDKIATKRNTYIEQ